MSEITIQNGIPIPSRFSNAPLKKKGDVAKYPFDKMRIGDSFFVAGAPHWRISNAAKSFSDYWGDLKFVCRTVVENGVEGTRCWRVAPSYRQ